MAIRAAAIHTCSDSSAVCLHRPLFVSGERWLSVPQLFILAVNLSAVYVGSCGRLSRKCEAQTRTNKMQMPRLFPRPACEAQFGVGAYCV